MKNNIPLLLISYATAGLMAACNSGTSSSSSSSGVANDNFSQITPSGGLQAPSASTTYSLTNSTSNNYMSFGNNGASLYSSTNNNGSLYVVNQDYSSWDMVTLSQPVKEPIVVVSPNGNNVFYVPYESNTAHSTGGKGFSISNGYITAITVSNNGSTYYGTSTGDIGLVNNPAGKTIEPFASITNFSGGPILAVGCGGNGSSCNSGQQGVIAYQAESNLVPVFESSTYSSSPEDYTYNSAIYYLTNKGWYNTDYNYIISTNNTVNIESYTFENVPEFVTTVAFNNSNIYVGTNFFNVYAANFSCNSGQANKDSCPVIFSRVNTQSLGSVENGSQGISYINVLPNGKILVVANQSESVINVYMSGSSKY